jgi:hypothetical protein
MTVHLGLLRTVGVARLSGGACESSFSRQSKMPLVVEAALLTMAFAAAQQAVLEVNLCLLYLVFNQKQSYQRAALLL